MSKLINRIPPAFKHGIYSGMTILPGEDPAAFKKLHNDLFADLAPVGPLEGDIVETIARLMWRKQNLLTYRLANKAKARYLAIRHILMPKGKPGFSIPPVWEDEPADPEQVRVAEQAAEEQARKELGPAWELVEIDAVATIDHLLDELPVVDRLDGMIDRCLKRLLFVRGLKSISSSPATPSPLRKRLAAA